MHQLVLQKNSQYSKKFSNNIDLVFLFYWGMLVFWQNINPGSAGSTADTLLKIVLLGVMTGYYILRNGLFKTRSLLFVFLILGNIFVPFFMEKSYNMRNLIDYFYPIFFAFLTFVVGEKYRMSKKQLLRFLNGVIIIVLYMTMYAIIFMPQKFVNALSLSNAYGNELSSFLTSSHEYGLYLFAGIVCCIMCLELDEKQSSLKKAYYTCCMIVFILNLILTFSRTSMLGAACILFIYILMKKKSWLKYILISGVIILGILIIFVPVINNFFFKIILKDNNAAGRDVLMGYAIAFFKQSSLLEKFFGMGISNTTHYFESVTEHESIHNAYLQVLLYFGIFGCIAMVAFPLCRVVECFKIIKINRFMGIMSFALSMSCMVIMFFNTTTLFFSPIDCFFFTVFTVVVPKYTINAVKTGVFDS